MRVTADAAKQDELKRTDHEVVRSRESQQNTAREPKGLVALFREASWIRKNRSHVVARTREGPRERAKQTVLT